MIIRKSQVYGNETILSKQNKKEPSRTPWVYKETVKVRKYFN